MQEKRRRKGNKAVIRGLASGRIRVRRTEAARFVARISQLASLTSAFVELPENDNFTRIKIQLQSLNELVSGMRFARRERRSMKEAVQQVVTIPNADYLQNIASRLNGVVTLLQTFGERIGVGSVINPVLAEVQNGIQTVMNDPAQRSDPIPLANLVINLPRYVMDAVKNPGERSRQRLGDVLQGIHQQSSVLGVSKQELGGMQAFTEGMDRLLGNGASSGDLSVQLANYTNALSGVVSGLNLPKAVREAALQSLLSILKNTSADHVQDHVEAKTAQGHGSPSSRETAEAGDSLESGRIRVAGLTGLTVAAGATGKNRATGTARVMTPGGITGITGVRGSTGATGNTGATVAFGSIGATGRASLKGSRGPTGRMGAASPAGTARTAGPTAPTGVVGVTGDRGLLGAPGCNGVTGTTGGTGMTRPKGAVSGRAVTVPSGAARVVGVTGTTGEAGIAGSAEATATEAASPAGMAGTTVSIGFTGVTGAAGVTGAVTITGLTGPIETTGVTGVIGSTGPTGGVEVTAVIRRTGTAGAAGASEVTDAAGSTGAGPWVGGAVLYNAAGRTQSVPAMSPIIFSQNELQGVTFNGTTTLAINTAGFYFINWQVALSNQQNSPGIFGIVVNSNTTSPANMASSANDDRVSGSAVINMKVGDTVQLYNLSAQTQTVTSTQTAARLNITRMGY